MGAGPDRERCRRSMCRSCRERMDSGAPFTLLDVREPFEVEMAQIEGANLIPLGELPARCA